MALKKQYQVAVVNDSNTTTTSVVFTGTTSSILDCGGTSPTGILLPANWLLSTLTFNVGKFSSSLVPLSVFDNGTVSYSIATPAGAVFIPLNPAMFNSVLFLQLVSSVNQTNSPTVDFMLSPVFQGVHN